MNFQQAISQESPSMFMFVSLSVDMSCFMGKEVETHK